MNCGVCACVSVHHCVHEILNDSRDDIVRIIVYGLVWFGMATRVSVCTHTTTFSVGDVCLLGILLMPLRAVSKYVHASIHIRSMCVPCCAEHRKKRQAGKRAQKKEKKKISYTCRQIQIRDAILKTCVFCLRYFVCARTRVF